MVGFSTVVMLFRPGGMTNDSIGQLTLARHLDRLGDGHPPLFSVIWAIGERFIRGPMSMLLFMNCLYWGGLAVTFHHYPLPRKWQGIAFLLVGFWPPAFSILGVIWKDVLMQAAIVGLLASFLVFRKTGGRRSFRMGLLFAFLAVSVRHNGVVAVFPMLGLHLAEHRLVRNWRPWKRNLTSWLTAGALSLAMYEGLQLLFSPFVRHQHFEQNIWIYDLAAMSVKADRSLFLPEDPVLQPGKGLAELKTVFDPRRNWRLFDCLPGTKPCERVLEHTVDSDKLAALKGNWSRQVRTQLRLYLSVRFDLYRDLIGLAGKPVFLHRDQIDPNKLGYKHTAERRHRVSRYLAIRNRLARTPLFAVWLYLAAALAIGVATIRDFWRARPPLAAALATSAILYHLTYFFLSGSAEFRYANWSILATLLAVFALPASLSKREGFSSP